MIHRIYKAVRVVDGKMFSTFVDNGKHTFVNGSKPQLEYQIGVKTVCIPGSVGIFCEKELEELNVFKEGDCKILLCESSCKPIMIPLFNSFDATLRPDHSWPDCVFRRECVSRKECIYYDSWVVESLTPLEVVWQ